LPRAVSRAPHHHDQENSMNWDTIEGRWAQLKGDLKSRWASLTDDDIQGIAGKRDKLLGKLQERYGILKDDADRQIDGWIDGINKKPRA
jgi:uncharacterized protein YjbJ (UPF0337 family)